MGICWGSPDFPTPSFRPVTSHPGKDLILSSTTATSDTARSAASSNTYRSQGSAAVSNNSTAGSSRGAAVAAAPVETVRDLKVFEYGELKALTNNFIVCASGLQGQSLPGLAQREGIVDSCPRVAVAELSLSTAPAALGYCLNGEEVFLVYESQEIRSSLEVHLFKSPSDVQNERTDTFPPLSWDIRLKIAVHAAEVLDFLHLLDLVFLTYFQASSILLDKSFGVKIAALNCVTTNSEATHRRANKNIVDFKERKAAEHQRRQDVYDFGVVLLELLTGLPLGRNKCYPEYTLRIEWIKHRIQSRDGLPILMDSRLMDYSREAAFLVAQVAVCCLELDPLHRPHIGQVLQTLNRIIESDESS